MIYDFGDRRFEASGSYYVAPSADVIGSVRLGNETSIWFNAVLRGDNDWIIIGDGTNIQDGSILHVDPGVPVVVGNRVTIGHGAMLHGCTIGDGALIGNRAVILDGAVVGARCLIAAGALVTPNTRIPADSVVMGAPGKVVRTVNERDIERMRIGSQSYRDKARVYAQLLGAPR